MVRATRNQPTTLEEEHSMEGVKDPSDFLDVERQVYHASRPGFRIAELTINATQKVPWHCHSNVQDTFYVLEGQLRIFFRDPKEEVRLAPGQTYSVRARRPHLVTNGGETPATFLVLQGIGEYDFIPLT
jgi:mannose-6-phosphate isomerase-like protein (cupin superfamily)